MLDRVQAHHRQRAGRPLSFTFRSRVGGSLDGSPRLTKRPFMNQSRPIAKACNRLHPMRLKLAQKTCITYLVVLGLLLSGPPMQVLAAVYTWDGNSSNWSSSSSWTPSGPPGTSRHGLLRFNNDDAGFTGWPPIGRQYHLRLRRQRLHIRHAHRLQYPHARRYRLDLGSSRQRGPGNASTTWW